jgi:hypothetical protein
MVPLLLLWRLPPQLLLQGGRRRRGDSPLLH